MIVLRNVRRISVAHEYGCLPDPPSSTDLLFSRTPLGLSAVTSQGDLDLTKFFKPISDQMHFPSCTANAAVDVVEALEVKSKNDSGMPLDQALSSTPELARMFAWWNGRNAMDPNRSKENYGCFNRIVVDGLARHGVPPESMWPYDNALVGAKLEPRYAVRPSISAYRAAAQRAIQGFYSIQEDGELRHTLLLRALSAGLPPVIAVVLNGDFAKHESGVIPLPKAGPFAGRHAVAVTGWSEELQAYKIRNSWTRYWGESGYCWMHKSYILSDYVGGIWVMSRRPL